MDLVNKLTSLQGQIERVVANYKKLKEENARLKGVVPIHPFIERLVRNFYRMPPADQGKHSAILKFYQTEEVNYERTLSLVLSKKKFNLVLVLREFTTQVGSELERQS